MYLRHPEDFYQYRVSDVKTEGAPPEVKSTAANGTPFTTGEVTPLFPKLQASTRVPLLLTTESPTTTPLDHVTSADHALKAVAQSKGVG